MRRTLPTSHHRSAPVRFLAILSLGSLLWYSTFSWTAAYADDPEPAPVDTTAPIVSITAPTDGTSVENSVNVDITATDETGLAKVELKLNDDVLVTLQGIFPATFAWDTTATINGSYILKAIATDTSDNIATSDPVNVTINNALPPPPPPSEDTTPPVVQWIAPASGIDVSGIAQLRANATDDVGVTGLQFMLDGLPLGGQQSNDSYSFDWDTAAASNGPHTLTAQATDAAGHTTSCDAITLIVNNSNGNVTDVNNTVTSTTNTGQNNSNGSDSGNPIEIQTGTANTGVLLPNEVNTNHVEIQAEIHADPIHRDQIVEVNVENENKAKLNNTITGSAQTGNNNANQNRFSSVTTGTANVYTSVVNSVNTNIVGAHMDSVVKNIVDTFTGAINFLDMMLGLFNQGGDVGGVRLNVNNQNQGSINNTINLDASSGGNSASGDPLAGCASNPKYIEAEVYNPETKKMDKVMQDNPNWVPNKCHRGAFIKTGDVNVAASVVNLLNTNIVGSNWLFATLNVFGNFIGDIILPGIGVLPGLDSSQANNLNIQNDNLAGITNNVSVHGDSGNNTTNNNRDGSQVSTGDVNVQSTVVNKVNTNIVGSNFYSFLPNIFGTWEGQVIDQGLGSYLRNGQSTDPNEYSINNSNNALITNNINVAASSGNNQADGNRFASIKTGNVRVATNLVNIANTNIVGSNWFLGNFNVFGTWKGNIVYAYPDLAVSESRPNTVQAGDTVTYTINYKNHGLAPARNVVIENTLPEHTALVSVSEGGVVANGKITWNLASMAAKTYDQSVSFAVHIDPTLPIGSTNIINQAKISTVTPEPNVTDNTLSDQLIVTVAPPPAPPAPPAPLSPTTPGPDQPAVAHPSMTIAKTNNTNGQARPGDTIIYRVAVTNAGDVPLENILVHDQLPGSNGKLLVNKTFSLEQLPVEAIMNVEYSVVISKDTPTGTYTNTAMAQATAQGIDVRSSVAKSSVQVSPTTVTKTTPATTKPAAKPPAKPKIVLVVSQSNNAKSKLRQGDRISFRVTAENKSTGTIKNVVLTGKLINGKTHTVKWKLGNIKKGEKVALTYTLNLADKAPIGPYKSTSQATGVSGKTTLVSNLATSKFSVIKKLKKSTAVAIKTTSLKQVGSVTRSGNKGLLFANAKGQPISAWDYAVLNKIDIATLLRNSSDPKDKAFVQTYLSGLTLVGKKGANGKIITRNDIVNDLYRNPQFRTIFGTSDKALAVSSW